MAIDPTIILGTCSVCSLTVRRRDGDPAELVRQAKKHVPHHHKRDYRIRPEPHQQDNDRGWMDHARGRGAW